MRLAYYILNNVNSVNSFNEVLKRTIQQGNPDTLYLRIVDLDQDDGLGNPLRYLPTTQATLTLNSTNIDPYKSFQRAAYMPYPNDDRSVWAMPVMALDRIEFNGIFGTLTDSANSATYFSTIQDLTFSSIGPFRSQVTISFVGGGTAGAEVVSLTSQYAIQIQIQSGVSTAAQVLAAFNASQAVALASASISGTASHAQIAFAPPVSLQSQTAQYTIRSLSELVSPVASGQLFC
jgi:hypothetical protein